jgi:hypothetical protein
VCRGNRCSDVGLCICTTHFFLVCPVGTFSQCSMDGVLLPITKVVKRTIMHVVVNIVYL